MNKSVELIGGPADGQLMIVHASAMSILIPVNYRATYHEGQRFYGYVVYEAEDGRPHKFRHTQTVGEPCEPFGAIWHG